MKEAQVKHLDGRVSAKYCTTCIHVCTLIHFFRDERAGFTMPDKALKNSPLSLNPV